MKALKLTIGVSLALAAISLAGGIEGRVLDENGNPRRGVTISVKGYRQTTTTDTNGFYTLNMPSMAEGTRVNVSVNGIFAVNWQPPEGRDN